MVLIPWNSYTVVNWIYSGETVTYLYNFTDKSEEWFWSQKVRVKRESPPVQTLSNVMETLYPSQIQ